MLQLLAWRLGQSRVLLYGGYYNFYAISVKFPVIAVTRNINMRGAIVS